MLIRHAQIDGGDGMDVRVRHGRIEAMAAALTPLADEEVINARGAALLPGLHDHHVHLYAFAAAQASVPCGPPQVREAQALRQALMQASTGLASGAWLRGIAYHESVAGEIDRDWLDAVLSDRAAPPNPNLRLYSHALGEAPLAWYAPVALLKERGRRFPAVLAELPVLLPTGHSAVRPQLDQWFERQGLRPRIAGEFEDSALLAAFGRSGMGAFPASRWSQDELARDPKLKLLGHSPELVEHFYLVSAERRIQHPLVQRLLAEPRTTAR